MDHTGVIKATLLGLVRMPEWVITAMNSIGDKGIGFEDEEGAEDLIIVSGTGELGLDVGLSQDTNIDQEIDSDGLEYDGAGEIDDAIRALEEAELPVEEEPTPGAIATRAERYAEYVAMGWREPEAQDVGKVVFNRKHRRSEAKPRPS